MRRQVACSARSGRAAMLLASALAMYVAGAQPAMSDVPEPTDYRGPPYNGAVTDTLRGAQVIDADEAIRLHEHGVPFIDVLPRMARPAGLPEGTLWREPVHESIPGAIWLYGTGYDKLSSEERARLARGLNAATAGDKAQPLVIFCRAECWLGWNAAKRAVEMGYRAVRWFPDGVDGWQVAGGDLVPVRPQD